MKELSMYRQLVYLPYMTSYKQLICGAVELDVFTQLQQPTTAAELAEKNGWHVANTQNLLEGLYSIGYIRRDGDRYCNTEDAARYLVRTSPEYMGAVLLGLAVIRDREGRSGVLYDQPPMQGLIEETIAQQGMQARAKAMTGDFLKDDIGSGYDLIICSSIMLFAAMGGPAFFGKLKAALNPGGVVLCLNEGIEADYSDPWEMVVGYMTYRMQGMPMGMLKGQVAAMAEAGGFTSVENRTELLSTGTHDVNILR